MVSEIERDHALDGHGRPRPRRRDRRAPATAALLSGTNGDDVIFGADDDNVDNLVIQPEGAVDQSLNNADAIDGKTVTTS